MCVGPFAGFIGRFITRVIACFMAGDLSILTSRPTSRNRDIPLAMANTHGFGKFRGRTEQFSDQARRPYHWFRAVKALDRANFCRADSGNGP